jgi:hypothetical protein
MIFITIDDTTGAFMAVDCIKVVIGRYVTEDTIGSLIIDYEGANFPSMLSPHDLRARIDAALSVTIN